MKEYIWWWWDFRKNSVVSFSYLLVYGSYVLFMYETIVSKRRLQYEADEL